MKIDLDKLDIDLDRLAFILIGAIIGYMCVAMALEFEIHYLQSRVVIGRLYNMMTDLDTKMPAEKGRPVSLPNPDDQTDPTS
jgi:hypothetical protein